MPAENNRNFQAMPAKEQPQEIDIHDLSHDGRGVGRMPELSASQGKACFVSGALPGERVQWKLTKSKRSFNEGNLLEVIKASSDRVEPVCEFYEACGGCQLQHLKPDAQLAWKERQLIKAVDKAGLNSINWLSPLSRGAWNYRRRARLAVSYKARDNVQIGFRSKGSHSLAEINKCVILDKRLNNLIPDLKKLAIELKNNGLTQIELSAADNQLAVCCYVKKPFVSHELDSWFELNAKAQIWLRLPGQDACPVSDDPQPLMTMLTDNTQMNFTPSQFVQVNSEMNRAMLSRALALSKPNKDTNVLDLFCGAGNFSLAFAERSKHVQGIEGSAGLCQQANENVESMGYANLHFQVMDLEKPENFREIKAGDIHLVILDPPRVGAANLMPWLNDLGAKKILYVSCHPATMVRDLQALSAKYQVESICAMDMFPHTAHLEAMALLVKS